MKKNLLLPLAAMMAHGLSDEPFIHFSKGLAYHEPTYMRKICKSCLCFKSGLCRVKPTHKACEKYRNK